MSSRPAAQAGRSPAPRLPRRLLALLLLGALVLISGGPGEAATLTAQTPPTPTATTVPGTPLPPTATAAAPPAAQPTPTTRPAGTPAVAAGDVLETALPLSRLGFVDTTLRGPQSSTHLRYALPAEWAPIAGSAIQLELAVLGRAATPASFAGGTLRVTYDGTLLGTLILDRLGDQTLTIAITSAALQSAPADGEHQLVLSYDAAPGCDPGSQTGVLIRQSSRLLLRYRPTPPLTDLGRLPRPLYQRLFLPEAAALVVPDQPSAAELQAALAVAAGLGRMSSGRLLLALYTSSSLPVSVRDGQHLVVISGGAGAPLLRGADLPAPLRGAQFAAPGAAPDDGIVQLIVSPWNPAKVLLVVAGNSPVAVIKAGQAVSAGPLRTGAQPNLALVSQVLSAAPPALAPGARTLAELSYGEETIGSLGQTSVQYRVEVPAGYVAARAGRFELHYSHSTLLSYERSGLVVRLNGQPVGSARFADDSAAGGVLELALPAALLRPGPNLLVVDVELTPSNPCFDARIGGFWVTLHATSLLQLPEPAAPAGLDVLDELRRYPAPYSLSPALGEMAFVLAPRSPVAWATAARLAFALGAHAHEGPVELAAAYADAVPAELRQRDLLVVGRASTLPILAELGPLLPAPFEPGSDRAVERDPAVVYRLPEGASVGYLQLVRSPWAAGRVILAVLGSTDEGVEWAGQALVEPSLRAGLSGSLALVAGDRIIFSGSPVAQPTPLPTSGASGTPLPPVVPPRLDWVLPALLATLALSLLLIVGVFVARLRRGRAPR